MPMIRAADNRWEGTPWPEWCELTHCQYVVLPPGAEIGNHYHDHHEYWLVIRGTAEATVEKEKFEIGPGDILLIEQGKDHSVRTHTEFRVVCIGGTLKEGGIKGHLHREDKSPSTGEKKNTKVK